MLWQNFLETVRDRSPEGLKNSMQAVISMVEAGATLQTIEKRLRDERVPVWLIAREHDPPRGSAQSLKPWAENTPAKYHLFMSRRPHDLALMEVLMESASYEVNFEKLADCGILMAQTNDADLGFLLMLAMNGNIKLTPEGLELLQRHFWGKKDQLVVRKPDVGERSRDGIPSDGNSSNSSPDSGDGKHQQG